MAFCDSVDSLGNKIHARHIHDTYQPKNIGQRENRKQMKMCAVCYGSVAGLLFSIGIWLKWGSTFSYLPTVKKNDRMKEAKKRKMHDTARKTKIFYIEM